MDFVTMVVILRAVHILGGVVWAGGAIALALFMSPLIAGNDTRAGLLALRANQKRIAKWTGISALLTMAAGIALYGELHPGAPRSTNDLTLTAGAIIAFLSFPAGGMIGGPAARKLAGIAKTLAGENREPTASEVSEIQQARARGRLAATVTAAFLAVAVICMAIWRYL